MAYRDLREFIADLDANLLRVNQSFSPEFEIAALLHATAQDGQAVLFENIAGYPGVRMIGNLLASRKRLAQALGTPVEKLAETYLRNKEQSLSPVMHEGAAPVKEVIHRAPKDLLSVLPVLTHHEKDAAPYITAGLVMAKDPDTGRRAMGIHRMMVQGGNRLGIFLANPPLSEFHQRAEAQGKPLEIAVALGVDPATLLASVVKVGPGGPDKLEIAGALRGIPMELVGAETLDLDVPARAEIVIEGHVLPEVRQQEGPFGENTGYYFTDNSPVMEVQAITHRHEFIYPSLCPWTADVDNILSLAAGTELLGQLQNHLPGVVDLELVTGTCGFTGVIAVSNYRPVDARRLMLLALGLDRRLKSITIVDDDVDIRNPREVAWAMATRFQPDRDTLVIDGMEGYVIDPSATEGGSGSKIGFDASCGLGEAFDRISIPAAAAAKVRKLLSE